MVAFNKENVIDNFNFKIINYKDTPQEVIEYEKALFEINNSKKYKKNNYLSIYNIIDNRAISKIPYENLIFITLKYNNELIAGTTINFNANIKMQLEYRNFFINKGEDRICEAFGFFSKKLKTTLRSTVIIAFTNYLINSMKEMERSKLYMTSTNKMARFHEKIGLNILEKKIVDNVEWNLICVDVKKQKNIPS